MSKSTRVGYQYPASRLRLIRKRWAVIVSIPAHLRHLYSNQRDKRKSTFTSHKSVADRLHHALAQQIYDEFDQKQNEHLTKHHAVTDNFAADTIYGLATSLNGIHTGRTTSIRYSRLFNLAIGRFHISYHHSIHPSH